MGNSKLTGAIAALLDEYKKAIDELVIVIKPISKERLLTIIDQNSKDPDSKSIQAILTHVVASCFSYSVYIENHIGLNTIRPERCFFDHVAPYIEKLHQAFSYCKNVFKQNPNLPLEELENSEKINTNWGQQYDVEQLLEHAIVHILRHRRQIENIIKE